MKRTDPPVSTKDMQQNPHAVTGARENRLEVAIGRQVHEYRLKLGMTVADLSRQAGLSAGMLSKIENGQTSPSLATLQALSGALNVPVTAFFRKFEEQRDATFVKAGEGLAIERRGTRAGHQYHLLGHSIGKSLVVEPYMVTLTETSDVFPIFQHAGSLLLGDSPRVVLRDQRLAPGLSRTDLSQDALELALVRRGQRVIIRGS